MTNKEAAVKTIVGCCAVIAREDVLLEIENYKRWQRLPKKGKPKYAPLLDVAKTAAKFEDMCEVALEQLAKVKE